MVVGCWKVVWLFFCLLHPSHWPLPSAQITFHLRKSKDLPIVPSFGLSTHPLLFLWRDIMVCCYVIYHCLVTDQILRSGYAWRKGLVAYPPTFWFFTACGWYPDVLKSTKGSYLSTLGLRILSNIRLPSQYGCMRHVWWCPNLIWR